MANIGGILVHLSFTLAYPSYGEVQRERERELDIRSVPPLPWNLHCFLVQFSCVIVTKCCYKFPYDICGDVILFVAAVWWSSCFHRVPRHVCVFVCVCVCVYSSLQGYFWLQLECGFFNKVHVQ